MSDSNHEKNFPGIAERRFTKVDIISKHLICTICQEVMNDPFRIYCGHTYCKNCIFGWEKKNSTCPICRKHFDSKKLSKDLLALNIINDLEVMCNNSGCPWKGPLSDLTQHLKVCLYNEAVMKALKKRQNSAEEKRVSSVSVARNGADKYFLRSSAIKPKFSYLETKVQGRATSSPFENSGNISVQNDTHEIKRISFTELGKKDISEKLTKTDKRTNSNKRKGGKKKIDSSEPKVDMNDLGRKKRKVKK